MTDMAIDTGPEHATDETADAPDRTTRTVVTVVVAAVGLLILWAAAPEAISATFSSPGTFLRVVAVVAAFMVFSFVVRRLVPNTWVARAIVAVPAIALTWWALSPYFGDDVVNEDFPVVASTPVDEQPASGEPASTAASDPSTVDGDETPATDVPATAPPETATTQPAEPVALGSGTFQGLTGHRGAGTATVYELPDGSRVLRLEDFDVSNGPDLEVHLVPGADIRGPGGGVQLADLKGNVGNQNYDIPADLELTGDWTILIWCESFTVEVANATATFS